MDIPHESFNNVLIFRIPEGEASISNSEVEEFLEFILTTNQTKFNRISFDMSKKAFLNSTGLGELVTLKDCLIDMGMELILLKPTEKVESLINMVGLDEFFSIVSTEEEL